MPRTAYKPDASFFRKIAVGAVGARAVCTNLDFFGHSIAELERGSTDIKIWKDIKRKRVRIPDLVCIRCGMRVESRAKVKAELSMSHSPTDTERAWSYGMIDSDVIAFPVCSASEDYWSNGRLNSGSSYWRERNWVNWTVTGRTNYFTVQALRNIAPSKSNTKGVTEGSETSIAWDAVFSTRTGTVISADAQHIRIRRTSDGHTHTWRIRDNYTVQVRAGDEVSVNQVIASPVIALTNTEIACSGVLATEQIEHLLTSRERTLRFTGIKLARLRGDGNYRQIIEDTTFDDEEDVYVRLEGASYLVAVCGIPAPDVFSRYLESLDNQTQLEAVISLGEAATKESVELLSALMDNDNQPYFLRSAAAWSLSRIGGNEATNRLIAAFSDVDRGIREEALEGVVALGGAALPVLLANLKSSDDIAAGCAEALRQAHLPRPVVDEIVRDVGSNDPSQWAVWLLGHLPREHVATQIAGLQESAPQLHYAISLLWSFVDSWISRNWELNPNP